MPRGRSIMSFREGKKEFFKAKRGRNWRLLCISTCAISAEDGKSFRHRYSQNVQTYILHSPFVCNFLWKFCNSFFYENAKEEIFNYVCACGDFLIFNIVFLPLFLIVRAHMNICMYTFKWFPF